VKESFYKETWGLGEIKETISRENLLAGLADAISASADSAETQEPAQGSSSSVNPPSEQPSTREKSEKSRKRRKDMRGWRGYPISSKLIMAHKIGKMAFTIFRTI
jgi:hypothetical protein